jgi:hypothetical protein
MTPRLWGGKTLERDGFGVKRRLVDRPILTSYKLGGPAWTGLGSHGKKGNTGQTPTELAGRVTAPN